MRLVTLVCKILIRANQTLVCKILIRANLTELSTFHSHRKDFPRENATNTSSRTKQEDVSST